MFLLAEFGSCRSRISLLQHTTRTPLLNGNFCPVPRYSPGNLQKPETRPIFAMASRRGVPTFLQVKDALYHGRILGKCARSELKKSQDSWFSGSNVILCSWFSGSNLVFLLAEFGWVSNTPNNQVSSLSVVM